MRIKLRNLSFPLRRKSSNGRYDACRLSENGKDTLVLCKAFVSLGSSQSTFAKEVASICIKACEVCEKECRVHESHHEVCKNCADSCQECILELKK